MAGLVAMGASHGANHGEDIDRLEQTILVALDGLEWIERKGAKAKSPYSLSKLTAGLPEEERGRVIDHAIRLMNRHMKRRRAEFATGSGAARQMKLEKAEPSREVEKVLSDMQSNIEDLRREAGWLHQVIEDGKLKNRIRKLLGR